VLLIIRQLGWYIWCAFVFLGIYFAVPIQQPGKTLLQPHYNNKLVPLSNIQTADVSFIDMTLQAGIVTPHSQKSGEVTGIHESLGAGICSFDANDDGWLDILILRGTGSTHYFGHPEWWQKSKNSVSLYINNRDGTFSDIAHESGLISNSISMGCAIGDLDADGDQDIFLANRGQNEIWENTGKVSFKQRLDFSQQSDEWSTSATIADFNNDGLPDVYVTNYLDFKPNSLTFEASAGFTEEKAPNFDPNLHSGVSNHLLINNGGLIFEDKAQPYGVSNPQGRGLASTASDVNRDGKLDILVANDSNSENKLYINIGQGFKDGSTESQLSVISRTPSIQVMNLGSETQDSLLASSGGTKFSRVLALDINKNDPVFKDISDTWKLNTLSGIHDVSWSPAIADFNMDGWQDALIVNGATLPNGDARKLSQAQAPYLLLNNRSDHFVKQGNGIGSSATATESSRCAVSGDFNNDGVPDAIIASNNGLAQLLINNAAPRNWVGLILKHTRNNILPIGAVIELTTNQRTIKRKIQNGTHGLCWQDNGRVSIPLKPNEKPIRVNVTHQEQVLASANTIKQGQYNVISSAGSANLTESLIDYTSIIALQSDMGKVTIIDFLLSEQLYKEASSELLLLLNNKEIRTQLTAASSINKLPVKYQLSFAPALLQSGDTALMSNGLDLIRNTEDDRLARWLFGAIMHSDDDIACKAMNILEHFFAEEEAMILSKYAGIDYLLRNALSDNEARQRCAIQALGESERYKVIAPLIGLLSSLNTTVRQDAIIALGRVREREALPGLLSRFTDKNETSLNRLFIIQSIKAIDPNFDEIGIMINALQSDNRSAYLETMALAFAPSSGTLQINNKTDLSKRVIDWYNTTQPTLSASENINYLKIVGSQYAAQLDELKTLSNNKNSLIKTSALLLLMKYNSKSIEYYLKQAIDVGELELFDSVPNLNLSAKLLFNALESPQESDQINIVKALFPHLSEQAKQNFIVQLLIQTETESKSILLNVAIEKHTPQLTPELCDSFRYLLGNRDRYTDSILKLTDLLGSTVIETCYPSKKHHQTLANNLLATPKLKHLAISFFAPKSERWARTLTQQYLRDASINQEDKLHTIGALRQKPFPSQVRILKQLFSNEANLVISMAAAQKLADEPIWIDENFDSIQIRIRNAIENNKEQTAVELGRILFKRLPQETLNIFLVPSAH
jgi:HEAT repeat protein